MWFDSDFERATAMIGAGWYNYKSLEQKKAKHHTKLENDWLPTENK